MTHQHVPLLYVMESMNTNLKISCKDQDLNPKQEASCKEVLNCLLHILSIITVAKNLCKVVCPELARIFQGIANVSSLEYWKILNLAEDSMVIQLADVPLQPLFHHIETCKHDLFVVDKRVNKELVVGTPM